MEIFCILIWVRITQGHTFIKFNCTLNIYVVSVCKLGFFENRKFFKSLNLNEPFWGNFFVFIIRKWAEDAHEEGSEVQGSIADEND